MATTDSSSKSTAVNALSTSADAESTQSNSSGNESNPSQCSSQRVINKVSYSPLGHSTTANSEKVMSTLSNHVQGTSRPPCEGRSVDKPFGQRAKKSFPQPKRLTIPQPIVGKDPNHPDIEVVEYIDKRRSLLEPHPGLKIQNHSSTLHYPACHVSKVHDMLQHSIKKDVTSGDEELHLTKLQQTPNVNKASPVPESERKDASPVRTPDQSIFSNSLSARISDEASERKASPSYASYRCTSPILEFEPSTSGPSDENMINDEEMNRTVTSTTSLFPVVGGGSAIDEEHKKSILASMKQAYTSELNQSDTALASESESGFNDSAGMPSLKGVKSDNSSCEGLADKTKLIPDVTVDSMDEELNSFAKQTLFSSSDSKTDLGLDSQEEAETNRELATTTTTSIDLTHSKLKHAVIKNMSEIQDAQLLRTSPLSPLNPLTDDLEAAMAKLHGEPLNDEALDDDMPVLNIPVTNIVLTKIVEQHSVSSQNLSDLDSTNQSDSDKKEADAASEKKKSPTKPYKFHKIGPKSKMGTSYVSTPKPFTSNTANKVSSVEAKSTIDDASDYTKTKSKAANAQKQHVRPSREVEKLCEDEMVQNILRDLEEKGLNKRRSTHSAVTYKEDQLNNSDKEVRSSRRGKRIKKEDGSFELETTPVKKKKMGRPKLILSSEESIPQDQVLQQWEPIHNSTNEDKVVYVPRKLATPADGAKIRRYHVYSSDSSADGNQNNNLESLHSLHGVPISRFTMDNCYMSGKLNEPGTSQHSTEDLVSKLSANCQEIDISFKDYLLCVKLCPRTSILRNSLNSNILKELSMVLRKLKMESSILVVLITSSGPDFCNGIDFPSLIHDNMAQRLESAVTVVCNLQEFIMELVNCDKLLVGGLVGSVMGLGVAMLPYLDYVYASDKTTFCLPYGDLGQSYEGGLSLTLPLISKSLNRSLFNGGRRLTATQAKGFGLIEDVFLPDNFEKEVVFRTCELAAKFPQSLLAGKKMSQVALRRDLPEILKEESQLLRQTWITDDFQRRAKQLYANGDLLLT